MHLRPHFLSSNTATILIHTILVDILTSMSTLHDTGTCLNSILWVVLVYNDSSGVMLVTLYDNLGQNAAFLLLPHGNSVPAHPDFDQGIEKFMYFIWFPGLLMASIDLTRYTSQPGLPMATKCLSGKKREGSYRVWAEMPVFVFEFRSPFPRLVHCAPW